jgi:hypothetical protein
MHGLFAPDFSNRQRNFRPGARVDAISHCATHHRSVLLRLRRQQFPAPPRIDRQIPSIGQSRVDHIFVVRTTHGEVHINDWLSLAWKSA